MTSAVSETRAQLPDEWAIGDWPLSYRSAALLVSVGTVTLSLLLGAALVRRPSLPFIVLCGALACLIAAARPRHLALFGIPLLLLVPPNVVLHVHGLPHLTPLRGLIFLCSGGALISLRSGPRTRRARLPRTFVAAACAFSVYVWLLSIAEGARGDSRQALVFTFGALAPLLLSWWALRDTRAASINASALVIVGAAASALAIYEMVRHRHLFAADGSYVFHAGDRYGLIRAQSVFPHPIIFGVVLTLLIPLALAQASEGRRWCWIALAVMGVALFGTISRGAWLSAVIAVAVTAARLRGRSLRYLGALGLTVLGAFLFVPAVGHGVDALLKPTSGEDTYVVTYRRQLLSAAQSRVEHHPFAATLDPQSLPEIVRTVNGQQVDLSLSVDNTYARYALQLGGVGLAFFLLLLAVVVWLTSRGASPLSAGILGGQAGLLVAALTVDTLTFEQVGVLFWALAGVGLWLAQQPQALQRETAADTQREGVSQRTSIASESRA